MSDVTQILQAVDAGDPRAATEFLPIVYEELRRLAGARLAHEKPGQTLEATASVHEAYLRLVAIPSASARSAQEKCGPSRIPNFDNRRLFFAAAVEANPTLDGGR